MQEENTIVSLSEKKQHILHVNIDNNGGNGAFSLVYYLYLYLHKDFIFDFFTMDQFVESKEKNFICSCGGKCYSANLRNNRILGHLKIFSVLKHVVKKNSYELVHIHSEVAYKQFIYALAAKSGGAKRIIIHSHSADVDGDYVIVKKVLHKLLKGIVCYLGTDFVACSKQAAQWMFSNKIIRNNKYIILNNGIFVDRYLYDENIRINVRKRLKYADNNIVLGHIGALKKVKNQKFLLDIIEKLIAKNDNYRLLLVGDGSDKEDLKKIILDKKLQNYVTLYGATDEVNSLLHAVDIFVFPSFFEGIPMALIEAQALGLPIVASDTINNLIKINDNVQFVNLKEGSERWANIISAINSRPCYKEGYSNVAKSGFNIKNSARKLKDIYLLETNRNEISRKK